MAKSLFSWADGPKEAPEPVNPAPQPTAAPPPAVNTFDLMPVKDRLTAFQTVIAAMVNEAQALDVVDDESNRQAVARASEAKRKWKEIKDTRKSILAPHAEFTASVNRLAKDCQGPLADVERILKIKISTYQTRIELERRKAEEAARIAAIELQKKIDAEAAANNVPAPQVVAPVLPDVPKVTRTEQGSASQVKTWVYKIIDPNAIPREYCVPDSRLLNQAVKNGIRSISGCEIYEETSIRLRT